LDQRQDFTHETTLKFQSCCNVNISTVNVRRFSMLFQRQDFNHVTMLKFTLIYHYIYFNLFCDMKMREYAHRFWSTQVLQNRRYLVRDTSLERNLSDGANCLKDTYTSQENKFLGCP
jgi:hypothetical protein